MHRRDTANIVKGGRKKDLQTTDCPTAPLIDKGEEGERCKTIREDIATISRLNAGSVHRQGCLEILRDAARLNSPNLVEMIPAEKHIRATARRHPMTTPSPEHNLIKKYILLSKKIETRYIDEILRALYESHG